MESLEELIKSENHEKILELSSPEYDRYKVIAAINLEKYEEALIYSTKNSFEEAYIFYKLKNFKRALRILRKLKGSNVEILKSQCLYFMGYYAEAYEILSKQGCTDEFAVNLSAMEALSSLNGPKVSVFTSKDSKSIKRKINYKFTDAECQLESEYNRAFRLLGREKDFVKELMELEEKFKITGSCITKQLKNMMDEEIEEMTKKETEIVEFNRGIRSKIEQPVLFQPNFMENESTVYSTFKDFQKNKQKYITNTKLFEPYNDKLKLLKAFIMSKRAYKAERSKKILEDLSKLEEKSIESDILKLLASDLPEQEFQLRALNLISKRP